MSRIENIALAPVHQAAQRLMDNVDRVVVGKRAAAELMMVALLTEGHVLVEDVPGIGKTLLARTVARSLGATFKRIQFTPDLLPSDVTGIHYFNQQTSRFEFRAGPIMAHIVLADEINRATPRTQSCLLEAMQERQVTVDGDTHPLPRPFLVMATQNPVEMEGTFPLPEAQLDRFLLRLTLGYPTEAEEGQILTRFEHDNPLEHLKPVIEAQELLRLQGLCRQVHVEESVRQYIVNVARATREHPSIELGASPRATLGLYAACQGLAAVRGRNFVLPDDAKELAAPVLAHRLVVKSEARLRGGSPEAVVAQVVASVPVPVEP
ncbi:MAG: MoxR family ATPase [Chloroflexota bacterium]